MMGTEMVAETSVIFNQLNWLIDQEDCIKFSRRERLRSYQHTYARMYDYILNVWLVTAQNLLVAHVTAEYRGNNLNDSAEIRLITPLR
jgi:hypothetical protein